MSSKANPLAAKSAETQTTEVSLLDQIVSQGRFGKDTIAQERGKDMVREFINQVLEGKMTLSRDAEATIAARIAEIDRLVSLQLNEVLHNPAFQKLEATWRGIWHLVNKSETSDMLKIKLLNVPKRDLLRDLQRALDFDQSAFFKKVYEEEFGVFGGAPFGALVGDYEFGRSGEDIELLEKVAQVAAAAHAPFLSAAAPEMINLTEFSQMTGIRDVSKVFDSTEYARWKGFRATDDSRYVALTLPHVLMREPYGKDTRQIDEFAFEEGVDGRDHSKYLWGNAAYSLAARLTDSFARYGWCAAIRGVEGGGLVESMATHNFRTDEGDVALKCPTEVSITDRREKELADQGFVPLVHCKGTDYAAFFSVQTCNKPKLYDKPEANANARLSAQLPYMLAMSRFAHYLKAMMRDKLGSTMSRSQAESFLSQWIANYVIEDDNASPDAKSARPLREARIEVMEVPGKPGALRAVAFLRPHFQLDELT
ncbi:MAG: type VI secretion system contractile sheath large subunit, partial [Terracidiphilus sp.]